MPLYRHVLPFAPPLHAQPLATDGWHFFSGNGPAAALQLPPAWPSLWLPLRGRMTMQAPDAHWCLHSGEAQLWRGTGLHVQSSHEARWLALAAPPEVWNRHFSALRPDEEPLPWRGEADGVHDAMEAVARDDCALDSLIAALLERQRDVAACLPRCRGRTLAHRRQALLRLLLLRHLMQCHVDADDDATIDVPWLAARAHYSPGHLIRLHRAVFGETPSDYFSRLRHARAWDLVRGTDMPVATITHKLGFESQSAFCRAFKHAFGMTATEARRRETDACAA